jgi:hypothetical protein
VNSRRPQFRRHDRAVEARVGQGDRRDLADHAHADRTGVTVVKENFGAASGGEEIPGERPVFDPGGTVTAVQAEPREDGIGQALAAGELTAAHEGREERLFHRTRCRVGGGRAGDVGTGDLEELGVGRADGRVAGAGLQQAGQERAPQPVGAADERRRDHKRRGPAPGATAGFERCADHAAGHRLAHSGGDEHRAGGPHGLLTG